MSIVSELQQEALSDKTSVTTLLRKALLVAQKLEAAGEFARWIELELNGYGSGDKIPGYRELSGIPHAYDPYRGYQPIEFAASSQASRCSKMIFHYPIAQIEGMVEGKKAGTIVASYAPEMAQRLMDAMRPRMTPSLHIEPSQFRGIVDAVRTAILKWAIELEKKGVEGSGMSFSRQEKVAASSTTVNIETYIGAMHQSQIQKDVQGSVQTLTVKEIDLAAVGKLIAEIESAIQRADDVPAEKLTEIRADLATIKAQLNSPKPKQPLIRECLTSLRAVMEEAGGSLVASGIVAALSILIGV